MNNTIDLNYLTRLSGQLAQSGSVRSTRTGGANFGDMAARLRTKRASSAQAVLEQADLSLDDYKQSIWKKISELPMSTSSRMQSISVQITDEGFEAMKNDPEYEAWVLDTLRRDFLFENPWTSVCGGGYVIHHFGAAKEQYHGESWYPGCMGGQGAALFDKKSEKSFWEQRMERHEQFMELQKKADARRRMLMKLRMNGGTVSAAELLMGLL